MTLTLIIEGRPLVGAACGPDVCHIMSDAEAKAIAEVRAERRAAERAARGDDGSRILHRSVLAALHDAGKLRACQARAGMEIALVYEAVTRAVCARTARYDCTGAVGASGNDWPPSLKAASQRYSAWATWAYTQAVTPRFSLVDLVQCVAIDGLGMTQAGGRLGLHHLTVLRRLQKGLWVYAEMAGWTELEKAA